MQLSALWCKPLITVHVLSWIPAWYIRRNRCECITLSNAAFASRSTRCQFCFSSVNILYASSTGRAAFMRDDPFVNPLCVGFCILWINGCILSLITALTILLITGRTVIPRKLMASFLLPTSNAAHFHILREFHQVKQWIGEADNMEAKDWGWSIEHNQI